MPRVVDLPVPPAEDPIAGLSFARMTVDIGPPAAVRVTYIQIRQSGAEAGEVDIQLGDAVPEEILAAMKPKDAAELRDADDRGDRASRFISKVLHPQFRERATTDLIEGGELVTT